MRRFAELLRGLESGRSSAHKAELIRRYFTRAIESDRVWAVALLSGQRLRRSVSSATLRAWAQEAAGIPPWMFDESYRVVGDLTETLALLLPEPPTAALAGRSLTAWMEWIVTLEALPDTEKQDAVCSAWSVLTHPERFVLNKLLTGTFRSTASRSIVIKALAHHEGLEEAIVVQRLKRDWKPQCTSYTQLIAAEARDERLSSPFPFMVAQPIDDPFANLGSTDGWLTEWMWCGIRVQIVRRTPEAFSVWSLGGELLTDRVPELRAARNLLSRSCVVDGHLVCARGTQLLPFHLLEARIERRSLSAHLLKSAPATFMAYDLLELDGEDLRTAPLRERRALLEELLEPLASDSVIRLSPRLPIANSEALKSLHNNARRHHAEGLVLKRLDAPYGTADQHNDWWLWKLTPLSVTAVLRYAQKQQGPGGARFSDYSFGVWDQGQFTIFARTSLGLDEHEREAVDEFIQHHTTERFGPVRTVKPALVFEIGFDRIQPSSRHKSGLVVHAPRVLRWRQDLHPRDADTLSRLHELLDEAHNG